jgi:hypothetical protein
VDERIFGDPRPVDSKLTVLQQYAAYAERQQKDYNVSSSLLVKPAVVSMGTPFRRIVADMMQRSGKGRAAHDILREAMKQLVENDVTITRVLARSQQQRNKVNSEK